MGDKAKGAEEAANRAAERSRREAIETRKEGEELRVQAVKLKKDLETLQAALQSWLMLEKSIQEAETKRAAAAETLKTTKEAKAQALSTIMRSSLSEGLVAAASQSAAPPP